jgi:hypothetical protein
VDAFPALRLADVFAVLSYYLGRTSGRDGLQGRLRMQRKAGREGAAPPSPWARASAEPRPP